MNKQLIRKLTLLAILAISVSACNETQEFQRSSDPSITALDVDQVVSDQLVSDQIAAVDFLNADEIYNPESVIPPQCYTKTEGDKNPCYVCHQSYKGKEGRPNIMNDGSLQGDYQFSEVGMTNSWKNLFVDRSEAIKKISDQEIKNWTEDDNYTPFIEQLKADKDWKGEIAEIKNLAFPQQAFDHNGVAKDGSHWVAFNYKPFPSTFWPTNGSTGDVMVRLPEAFREINGQYNQDVYFANLALLELAVKDLDRTSLLAVSERNIGVDLDGDEKLSDSVENILKRDSYVGDASHIKLAKMLYPEATEFLHTVRYIGIDEEGNAYNAPRMKEVRYMRKSQFRSKEFLSSAYYSEAKEKNSEKLPVTVHLGDRGIDNGFTWVINGYIENPDGSLRQQHREELAFCNGCHKTVGTTYDQTFSFARKLDGKDGWGYIDLTKLEDAPNLGSHQGEYLTYMQRVGGGDEFRQNQEMLQRWFKSNGTIDKDKITSVSSLYELIMPSTERALALNKAYKVIVDEQSYIFGRDAVLKPATNVLQAVDDDIAPLQESHRHQWDLRLDWQKQQDADVAFLK